MTTATEQQVLINFRKDTSRHSMAVLKDDGVYRHLSFSDNGSSVFRFDLVTWPGYLCYCGDMGEFVFSRCDDMFAFFRRGDGGINPGYWSEKVQASGRDGVKAYSPNKAKQVLVGWVEDLEDQGLVESVRDDLFGAADDGEHSLRQAVEDFNDEHDSPFMDFFEADLTDYSYRFLWCCYAIVWGIKQYDEYKT